jgi:membrane protease YdiL (CAAX protease family)
LVPVLATYVLVIVAWIGAWLLHESIGLGGQSEALDTLYWTGAKILIWLLPIPIVARACLGKPVTHSLPLGRWGSGVRIGLIFGVAFVGLSLIGDGFAKRPALPTVSPGLLNALVIAPLFEEIVFRGFMLTSVQDAGLPFWGANSLTAVLFLGLHLPGWSFMASPNLTQPMAMVGIVLVGLGAGLSRQRSGSLWGSITFHAVNNLAGAILR